MDHRGFYKSQRMPHFDAAGQIQFITVVLAEAAPINQKPLQIKPQMDGDADFLRMDSILDHSNSACIFNQAELAEIVCTQICSCPEYGGIPLAWVVMPNHVHLLLGQVEGFRLSEVVRKLKGKSAFLINQMLGTRGKLWQKGYYDRAVRSQEHLGDIVEYIHENPVSAGLVANPGAWRMSSIHEFSYEQLLQQIETHHLRVLS